MRPAYDAAAIRAAEQPLLDALPAGTLMRRAAHALARRSADLLGGTYGRRVVLLVGGGNNGGDALLAGAALARRGARVDALLVTDSPLAEARRELELAGGRLVAAGTESDLPLLGSADVVLDGLVGIGASGSLRPPAARLARILAAPSADRRGIVVAVDVPSGVDASTGEIAGAAVRADVTVTFGAAKIGLLVAPGAWYAGTVEVVDLGLPLPAAHVTALDADDVGGMLPRPGPESDKYRRGVVGVVTGSDRYPGAAAMSVGGAVRAGAGMVRYVGPAAPARLVRARWPEAVVTVLDTGTDVRAAGRVQAWVVGSGLGTDDRAAAIVQAVLAADEPVLLDADGIAAVTAHPEWLRGRRAPTLLTPHAGEFARLRGLEPAEVEASRLAHVRAAARDLGVTVLLKGGTTLVADPSGEVRVNTAQTVFLATAGSGDVLGGICGSLLAGGLSALDAGAAGAFVHGLAGVLAAGVPAAPIAAMDIADAVPQALRALAG